MPYALARHVTRTLERGHIYRLKGERTDYVCAGRTLWTVPDWEHGNGPSFSMNVDGNLVGTGTGVVLPLREFRDTGRTMDVEADE